MREIRQPRDLAGLRGSWLERGGGNTESRLRPQRCLTCHPGAGPQSAWILHPTASLPPAGSSARPAVPSSGATVAPGPPGVVGPECQSTGLMRVSTDLLQSLSLGIFRAPFWGSNAAPRQPGWHKASSPAFVYTGHDSRETNPRRAGKEYQGHLPGLTSRFEAARTAKGVKESSRCVGTCLQFGFLREMRHTWTRFIASRG